MARKIKIFEIIAILYVLLEPVLAMYGWSNFSFATGLMYILVLLYICQSIRYKQNPFCKLPQLLTIYFVWLLLCNYISFGALIPFGNILIWLVFCMLFSTLSLERLVYVYKLIAILAITLFVIQEISYYTTGYRVLGIIRWLPLSYSGQDIDVAKYISTRELIDRSSSFFSEPAHFAQFLFPLFAITLFRANNLRSYIFPLIIAMILLLLKSGNALIGFVIISVMYIIHLLHSRSLVRKIIIVVMSLFVTLLGGYYYMRSSVGEKLLGRQETISGEMDSSSGFFRIYRGYYVFEAYSPVEKIIGINNFSKIKQRRDASKIAFLVENDDDLYFNCIQHFLLRTGYIGLFIFVLLCLSLWKNNTYEGKAIILTFFILSFFASLYMSSIMMLYIFISYAYKNKSQDRGCRLINCE